VISLCFFVPRLVPVYPALVRLGFLDYVKALKAGPLFPGLTRRESKGGKADARVGELFRKKLVALGLKREGLCFHSFRHTVAGRLDAAGVPQSDAARILGHAVAGAIDFAAKVEASHAERVVLDHGEDFIARRAPAPGAVDSGICPSGYSSSPTSGFCTPNPNTREQAIPKPGLAPCPSGARESTQSFCVQERSR
jgi:hypothetical protein